MAAAEGGHRTCYLPWHKGSLTRNVNRGAATMKNIFGRNLLMMLMVGLGLALTPGTARADFLDFTVDETVVPGTDASGFIFVADEIEGGFAEVITFDGLGGFEATIVADFSTYRSAEGDLLVASHLATTELLDTQYAMY